MAEELVTEELSQRVLLRVARSIHTQLQQLQAVDLNKLKAENMHRQGNSWIVDLPEPELLDFAIVPGSVGCMTKATLVPKVADFCRGGSIRQALEARLGEHAMTFAKENGMLPSRAEIVRQLNEAIKPLLRGTEAMIVFQ
jgi:hypothetical protein